MSQNNPIATAAIAKRAYQLFRRRGGAEGRALDDWLTAEREILRILGRHDSGGLSPLDGVSDNSRTLLPQPLPIPDVTSVTEETDLTTPALSTRNHAVIRQWAAWRHAEPATGEQTSSGPATVAVTDGGAGLRFNFPGTGRFRPIAWAEWFGHFDQQELAFVYENDVAAPMLSHRYRLVHAADIQT